MPKVWNKSDPNCPKDAIYVGRPSKWGNPYKIGKDGARELVISYYRTWLWSTPWKIDLIGRIRLWLTASAILLPNTGKVKHQSSCLSALLPSLVNTLAEVCTCGNPSRNSLRWLLQSFHGWTLRNGCLLVEHGWWAQC